LIMNSENSPKESLEIGVISQPMMNSDKSPIESLRVILDKSRCTVPWWLKLGGATDSSSGPAWRAWQVLYFFGVFGMSVFRLLNIFANDPNDIAIFVLFKNQPSKALLTAEKFIVTLLCICTVILYIWVLKTKWKMPPLPEDTRLKYRKAAAIYLIFLLALLISGNVTNPGTWPWWMNVFVWGLLGAIFVWYPFLVTFSMFISECLNHKRWLNEFEKILQDQHGQAAIDKEYFYAVDSVMEVNKTFLKILPMQLFILMLAICTNVICALVADSFQEDVFGTYFVVIGMSPFLIIQAAAPICFAAWYNNACDRVLRAIAKRADFKILLQTGYWPLFITIGGYKVTYGSLLYGVPVVAGDLYSLYKVINSNISIEAIPKWLRVY